MKPTIVEIKKSRYSSKGKEYWKKVISVSQNVLPDIGAQVVICEPKLLDGFKILNTAFQNLINSRNPEIFEILRQHITKENAALLTEVAESVI